MNSEHCNSKKAVKNNEHRWTRMIRECWQSINLWFPTLLYLDCQFYTEIYALKIEHAQSFHSMSLCWVFVCAKWNACSGDSAKEGVKDCSYCLTPKLPPLPTTILVSSLQFSVLNLCALYVITAFPSQLYYHLDGIVIM